MSTWHGVMADGEEFMRWKISTNTVYNTLKTDTKYSQSVRSRDKECFRNGLVRKPYERSFYEGTKPNQTNQVNQAFIEKRVISTELPNVN